MGENVFLAGGCREVLEIKDEVGSIDGFGEGSIRAMLVWCKNMAWDWSRI